MFLRFVQRNWTFVNKKFTIEGWLSTIRFISSSSSGEEGSESDWPWSVQVMYWTEPLWIKKKYSLWPYWHSMGPCAIGEHLILDILIASWSSSSDRRQNDLLYIEGQRMQLLTAVENRTLGWNFSFFFVSFGGLGAHLNSWTNNCKVCSALTSTNWNITILLAAAIHGVGAAVARWSFQCRELVHVHTSPSFKYYINCVGLS